MTVLSEQNCQDEEVNYFRKQFFSFCKVYDVCTVETP